MAWFDRIPLPVMAVAILAALFLATEAGFYCHRRLLKGRKEADPGSHDYLLTAALGLLALLLGFTFSLAINRYELRRDLVVQEANALGTTWLRVQLLQPPLKDQMSGLLRDYLDERLVWSNAPSTIAVTDRSVQLEKELWAATGQAMRTDPNQPFTRGLMDVMNESFDLAEARTAARAAQVPSRVMELLLVYALLSAGMLGYTAAARGRPERAPIVAVMLLLTLAMVIIMDIDRPSGGAVLVSQQPLEDLKQFWR